MKRTVVYKGDAAYSRSSYLTLEGDTVEFDCSDGEYGPIRFPLRVLLKMIYKHIPKMNKETLDILIDSMSDTEWNELRLRADAKKAFNASNIFSAKRSSAIEFGDWILKHTVLPSYDEDGSACWVVADGTGTTYTSLELYNAYMNGEFEPDDDDMGDWDVTLMDGLDS